MLGQKTGSEQEPARSSLPGYGIAVLAVGLALLLKLLLDPMIYEESPFLLFFGAVMVGAWFGGLGPGLLATALATLASDYFFLAPTQPLLVDGFGQSLRLIIFVLEGSLISLLAGTMHSARRYAEERTLQSWRDQENLRRSEERFRVTFEQAAAGIAHVGFGGEWLRVNQKLCDIVGYTREELLQRTFQDITHPDDLDKDLELFGRLMAGEIPTYSMEKRYFHKDGSIVWIDLTVSAASDEEGKPEYCISVIEDITERKRAEEERALLLARERQARTEAVAARKRLALLAEAGPMLSASLDYAATLERITRLIVPELADWCLLDIVEEDGSVNQLAAAHADPKKESLLRELGERRTLGAHTIWETQRVYSHLLRTGEPILLPEVTDEALIENSADKAQLALLRELEPHSCICVPLRARGRTLGTITLVSSREDLRYGAEDLSLAESLAYRCALAVDNARLYQGRSEIARTLQESLLPSRLPDVPGVEVGLRYLPAGEVDVGGDFYDLFETSPGDRSGDADSSGPYSSWGVAIGDVCGKGAEAAAAVLALARYTIRAVAMHEARPSAVLAGLNEAMLRQRSERDDHKFCTIAYARLETQGPAQRGARVAVCRGGHPAPVLLKAGGSIQKIGDPGRAIGVFENLGLTEQEINLLPGDALVLYTDGVVEARSPDGAFFGEERLVSLLRSSAGLDASTLAGRVETAVLEFQENNPHDDVAVLVLKAV